MAIYRRNADNGPAPVPTSPVEPDRFILKTGDTGEAVRLIQEALQRRGFQTGGSDGIYGPATEAAVQAFQQTRKLYASGWVDDATLKALGYQVETGRPAAAGPLAERFTLARVSKMFPDAPVENIRRYLPLVLDALEAADLGDDAMALMALATIRAESAGFQPIDEQPSRFNTAPGGKPFGLYDFRKDLGNGAIGDGARYRGRGFIQLTGKYNYGLYSQRLGKGDALLRNPELANDPEIAAQILAAFLKNAEAAISRALQASRLGEARKLVNGGMHGVERFRAAYTAGLQALKNA